MPLAGLPWLMAGFALSPPQARPPLVLPAVAPRQSLAFPLSLDKQSNFKAVYSAR